MIPDTKFCDVCNAHYDAAAPECPGCAGCDRSEEQREAIARLTKERDNAYAALESARRELLDVISGAGWQSVIADIIKGADKYRREAERLRYAEMARLSKERWYNKCRRQRDEAEKAVRILAAALDDITETDYSYGDGCPSNAGTRHGTCTACIARKALEDAGMPKDLRELP